MTVVERLLDSNGSVDPRKHMGFIFGLDEHGAPNPPTLWDDASQRAAYQIIEHSFKTWNRFSDIREYLDYLIGLMGPDSKTPISNNVAAEYWAIFGSICFSAGQKLHVFDKPAAAHIDEISDILIRKQRDYGHDNISRFGRTGILIRLHDKVARLENLHRHAVAPENESVVDNFVDLIGYSSIGIMWERGWYMLPLEEAKS